MTKKCFTRFWKQSDLGLAVAVCVCLCVGQCSVTCGEGQQTREVICVGPGGEHLADHACSGLSRPASVQACRRPACYTRITWHVTEYGLVGKTKSISLLRADIFCEPFPVVSVQCTRSCGGGVRERKVSCFDTDLNPYPEDRCGAASKPISVETCNSQPCPRPQSKPDLSPFCTNFQSLNSYVNQFAFSLAVPSVQDPRAHGNTFRGYVPHVPGEPSGKRLECFVAKPIIIIN